MLAVYVMGKEFTGCQYIRFSVISSFPLCCEEKLGILCSTKWFFDIDRPS